MKPTSSNKKRLLTTTAIIGAIIILAGGVIAFSSKKPNAATTTPTTGDSATPSTSSTPSTPSSVSATYKDGTYAATGSYRTPQSTESIKVTLTIKGGIVTASDVSMSPQIHDSAEYQSMFKASYKPLVVGHNLDDISLTTVSGSSLTPIGFNSALQTIKAQAKS